MRRPSKRQIKLLCGESGPGDGRDPRHDPPEQAQARGPGRKALQLCRQVQEALTDALATACQDPLLRELTVVSVEPAPNTSCLLVTLSIDSNDVDPARVAAHLQGAAGLLRCEVAAAIHRRKVPELTFAVVTP